MSLLPQKRTETAPAIIEAFNTYFEQIKKLDAKDATEHTLRPALHNLLIVLAEEKNPKIKVIPEPRRDESGRGAPDVKFKIGESILGYLENKKIETDLKKTLKTDQIEKYKKLSGNLILTNYLEWIWLKEGAVIESETLAHADDVGNRKARLNPDKAEKVGKLIENFLSTAPKGIGRVKDLALALAARCHDLREFLAEELIRQEKEHQQERLFGLFNVFKKDVFHELSLAGFADAFAQTLGYGLFLARLNSNGKAPITLGNAKQYIPANFELIRELVNFLDELDKPEYSRIRWLIEEILNIMNALDLTAIHEDLAFTKRQGRLLGQTEEERLLFAKDPYVYFYEDFLKAYDSAMRKSRGVYYTPPPVVNFIVRAINDILKDTFGIKTGLADRKRVTVLDFATGTGTFLLEILQQIFDVVSDGLRDDVIREHALKNLYGFEYLIAPYTIAHLKLSQYLHDKGFRMKSRERLQIYLTNTLEPIEPQPNFLLPALSKEVEDAQKIKEKPILVITGNPPYSGHSQNKGKWISNLIETYKQVDGRPLGEKNPKWLQDDYVKFIRFAQWKLDQVDEGIVGIITNHSFLDNPTFRGMRQSLMQTFNQIYILDLHGNTKKKETAPDGGKDDNVFDIEQGVSISLLVKKKGLAQKISHADFWGRRVDKYRACMETDFGKVEWRSLQPQSPFYLFISQNETSRAAYEEGWKVTDILLQNAVGICSKKDEVVFHNTKEELLKVIGDFFHKSEDEIRRKYETGQDSRDWKVKSAKENIAQFGLQDKYIQPILYRPFDVQFTYYTNKSRGFLAYPVYQLQKHMLGNTNMGLIFSRNVEIRRGWEHVHCSSFPINLHTVSLKEGNYIAPLYLYAFPEDKKQKSSLFDEPDPFNGKDRIENLAPEFRKFIDKKYGHHYEPEEIFGYIYAVLHNPTYRKKYAEFLKIDFPRIPFADDRKTFEKLSALGWGLVQAHLLKDIPAKPKIDVIKGSDEVGKPVYNPQEERLYFNEKQYFAPMPEDVWNFHIGGYQVLDKYLKSRKGRKLSLDEKENIINIIKVVRFTIDQMVKIDEIWKP